jgi:2-methylisocitrate lyase-like PEP mutase family enzyme
MTATHDALRRRFRQLHESGTFVMPNPWDIGSARLLVSAGFPALATTSSGHAASLGRGDGEVTLDELVAHVAALSAAVDVPLNVDAERCFAAETSGIAITVARLAEAGASGLSIEDFNPDGRQIDPIGQATERVAAAAEAARDHGVVLTARAENHIHGIDDLDDTLARLVAYRDAGAPVVYAPGLIDLDDIARVVALGVPVNVLARANGPSVGELASVGVRRVSTGGALAFVAYSELLRAATELATDGTSTYQKRIAGRQDLVTRLSGG